MPNLSILILAAAQGTVALHESLRKGQEAVGLTIYKHLNMYVSSAGYPQAQIGITSNSFQRRAP